ncbi:histidine phosphatase family protein [Chitinophaga pendula]|uniref:histidine phosphatase family protein n=1 Tax=Chitinophaga TaxID=79328 RepID=UPI000BB03930|nr:MULTISPECIES: histidine phosphatase family protein [Chitinophaga]ASZ13802.1 histidine phosphatase family protein [Chitinophaga sp. MD30]UCJ08579.1 histidine phosphatase family protein [Chitinophaga pendula]
MTQIGIIRHGITQWNKEGRAQGSTDIPLDEEGILQAHLLGKKLAQEPWDRIFASDLKRARETAEIIAGYVGIDAVLTDIRLREAGAGQLEGTTEAERVVKWGATWKTLDLGGESKEEVVARGLSFLQDITAHYPGEKILIVSHGAFIRYLLPALLPDIAITEPLKNTSLTRLVRLESSWNCELYNCTLHLDVAV